MSDKMIHQVSNMRSSDGLKKSAITTSRAHKNWRLHVTPIEARSQGRAKLLKLEHLLTCTLSNINKMASFYAHTCAVCVTIVSTESKFCPVSNFM